MESFSSDIQRQENIDEPAFDGKTYDHDKDGKRLGVQYNNVFVTMSDGCWHTLREIADKIHAPESSISARLRDMRKPRFGEHKVERRRRAHGLWEYRLIPTQFI